MTLSLPQDLAATGRPDAWLATVDDSVGAWELFQPATGHRIFGDRSPKGMYSLNWRVASLVPEDPEDPEEYQRHTHHLCFCRDERDVERSLLLIGRALGAVFLSNREDGEHLDRPADVDALLAELAARPAAPTEAP